MGYLCDPTNRYNDSVPADCQVWGDFCQNQTFFTQFKQYSEKETDWTVCGGTWPGQMLLSTCEYCH